MEAVFTPKLPQERAEKQSLWGSTGEIQRWTGKSFPAQGAPTCHLTLTLGRVPGAPQYCWDDSLKLEYSDVPESVSGSMLGGPRLRGEHYLTSGMPTERRELLPLLQVREQKPCEVTEWGEERKHASGHILPVLSSGMSRPLSYPAYVTPCDFKCHCSLTNLSPVISAESIIIINSSDG